MISKNQIKILNSLKLKKFRDTHRMFIAEGTKIVPELLNSEMNVKQIFAIKEWIEANKSKIKNKKIEIFTVSKAELEKISSLTVPNEVLGVVDFPNYDFDSKSVLSQLTLVLDEMKDPGNLGTIIRIADWFGIENIICSHHSVDVFNPKVIQSTMGSIARVKVHYMNLENLFSTIKSKENSLPIYGATLDGENIYQKKIADKGLIIIGNESKGISDEIQSYVTDKITIPPYLNPLIKGEFATSSSLGERSESLNAAIATAIICAEFRRRKK